MSLNALGGGVLAGSNIVRLTYLDDAAIGKIEDDPYAVVAGVIVNADFQWKQIEAYLKCLVTEYLPDTDKPVFHASDIWHGSRLFSRDKFPDKWPRRMILLELCEIPKKFDLPVIFGYVPRAAFNAHFQRYTDKARLAGSLGMCALQCAAGVERYMRRLEDKNEVAMMIYENNNNSRMYIRKMHNSLKNPSIAESALQADLKEYFPLERIVDTAHFADKSDTSLLQVADAVAFAVSRKLKNAEDCNYLFEPLDQLMVMRHNSWPARGSFS